MRRFSKVWADEPKISKAKARVWCRDCGKEMSQAPYDILAFYCHKCGIKAEISFDKTPVVKI